MMDGCLKTNTFLSRVTIIQSVEANHSHHDNECSIPLDNSDEDRVEERELGRGQRSEEAQGFFTMKERGGSVRIRSWCRLRRSCSPGQRSFLSQLPVMLLSRK